MAQSGLSARPSRRCPARVRAAGVLVAAAVAVPLLGGCGFETRQQAAAVVNGHVIHEDDVATTAEQLKSARLDFSENIVVTALIAAPLLDSARGGTYQPDQVYAQTIASIPDATDTTKEFVKAVATIQAGTLSTQQVTTYRNELKTADISVNPKFGTVVPSNEGPVYFSLGASQPNWIKPGSGATTVATAPAQQ